MKQITKIVVVVFIITLFKIQLKADNLDLITNSNKVQHAAIGIGDFFKKIGNAILDVGRPVWGSYKVSGQNNSAPIALFKRSTFEKDKLEIINRIKITNTDFWKIYEKIFTIATNENTYTIPAATGEAQKYETRATFAKNAAFVLVMNQKNPESRAQNLDRLYFNL